MSRRRQLPRLLRSLVPALLIVLALGGATAVRGAQTSVQAAIANFAFTPDPITIRVGETVTWTNRDAAAHTVTADNGAFDSGLLRQGQQFSYTATTAGTFTYYCRPHPFMRATLTVEAAPGDTSGRRCFGETGRCAGGRFLAYWAANGGLAINGFPISEEFPETLEDGKPYLVQYYERARFEYHPENPPPFDVLLGQFGRLIRPADPPVAPAAGATYFGETGHNLSGSFLQYWGANGGLAQFGLPISEEFEQQLEDGKVYRVQYFERARFEYHPENPPPFDVLLGQFGRLILGNR